MRFLLYPAGLLAWIGAAHAFLWPPEWVWFVGGS